MECIQSQILNQIKGLKHGFFCPGDTGNREENLSYKSGSIEQVQHARARACGFLGIQSSHLTHVYQEHGAVIWDVRLTNRGAGANTGEGQVGNGDAMITPDPNLPLAILIADCLPIYFSTHDASIIGIAHAGWRGSDENISGKMVERFISKHAVQPDELFIWIGPGISKENFEVGEEVLALFRDHWSSLSDCVQEAPRRIDLKRLNYDQLIQAGVLPERIEISPDCTYADRRFFSYRRDGAGIGHNMAVIEREA